MYISGRLLELLAQLALAINTHCLVNRHPIPDTPCSRLETINGYMLPPGSSGFIWLCCCCWLFIACAGML